MRGNKEVTSWCKRSKRQEAPMKKWGKKLGRDSAWLGPWYVNEARQNSALFRAPKSQDEERQPSQLGEKRPGSVSASKAKLDSEKPKGECGNCICMGRWGEKAQCWPRG